MLTLLLFACGAVCPVDLPAIDYTDAARWMCRPGRDDVCSRPLRTFDASVQPPRETASVPAADPGVDCFWVYPTVDLRDRVALHEDLTDVEDAAVAIRMQAARLHEVCRVWAPAYRQVTLGAFERPESAGQCFEAAYDDVDAAFEQFLAEIGDRPFVLAGHSQGGQIVARLVRERVETQPERLDRLVLAAPIGWPIRTAAGRLTGGSFATVPLCTAADQTGCAVAWGSVLSGEPLPTEIPPFEPGDAMACTAPSDAPDGRLSTVFFPAEPAIVKVPAGVPIASDVWVSWTDQWTGTCEVDGPHAWLRVNWVGDGPSPAAFNVWTTGRDGSHILDMQFGMGDLEASIAARTAAWAAAHPNP